MNLRLSLIEQSDVCRTAQESNISALSRAVNDAALVVGRLQDFARQKADRSPDCIDISASWGRRSTWCAPPSREKAPSTARRFGFEPTCRLCLTSRPSHPKYGTWWSTCCSTRAMRFPKVAPSRWSGAPETSVSSWKCSMTAAAFPTKIWKTSFAPSSPPRAPSAPGSGSSTRAPGWDGSEGEISASNRPEGGACFTLSFPHRAPRPRPLAETLRHPRSARPPHPGHRRRSRQFAGDQNGHGAARSIGRHRANGNGGDRARLVGRALRSRLLRSRDAGHERLAYRARDPARFHRGPSSTCSPAGHRPSKRTIHAVGG